MIKEWPGFEAGEGVYDHVIRYLAGDYKLFARMREGDQYPNACRGAVGPFDRRLSAAAKNGERIIRGSEDYERLKGSMVPPYDTGKFPNKWRKISRGQPVRTIGAHLGKDGYSHIHYDSKQARTISVREAARLQSIPDGFRFAGAMNAAFRQIGNAFPPLLDRAMAAKMVKSLQASAGACPSGAGGRKTNGAGSAARGCASGAPETAGGA